MNMEDWKVWANYYDKTYPSHFVKACDDSKKRQETKITNSDKNKPLKK